MVRLTKCRSHPIHFCMRKCTLQKDPYFRLGPHHKAQYSEYSCLPKFVRHFVNKCQMYLHPTLDILQYAIITAIPQQASFCKSLQYDIMLCLQRLYHSWNIATFNISTDSAYGACNVTNLIFLKWGTGESLVVCQPNQKKAEYCRAQYQTPIFETRSLAALHFSIIISNCSRFISKLSPLSFLSISFSIKTSSSYFSVTRATGTWTSIPLKKTELVEYLFKGNK